MSIPPELGMNALNPFGSYWTRYPEAVSNNDYFVNLILNNCSRMRCITKTNELTETADNPGGSQGAAPAHRYWVSSVKAANPSFPILYGIDNGGSVKYYPPHHSFYRSRLLIEAAWAEANHMDGFAVGVEHEVAHASGSNLVTVATLTRSSNVVTATFATPHGFTTGQEITVSGASPSTFNVADSITSPTNVIVTVIDSTTLTYPNIGADESATGTLKMGWSYHQERSMIKADAAAAQAIFSGYLTYCCSQGYEQGWINDGITPGTNLDKIGFNIYGDVGNDNWTTFKSHLDTCWNAFGTNMILAEMNASDPGTWNNTSISGITPSSTAFYKLWEDELVRRFNYAKSLGLEQIFIYTAWDIENKFSLFYNEGSQNGQPTSTLFLDALFSGSFLPVVDRLCNRRSSSIFLGSMESQ